MGMLKVFNKLVYTGVFYTSAHKEKEATKQHYKSSGSVLHLWQNKGYFLVSNLLCVGGLDQLFHDVVAVLIFRQDGLHLTAFEVRFDETRTLQLFVFRLALNSLDLDWQFGIVETYGLEVVLPELAHAHVSVGIVSLENKLQLLDVCKFVGGVFVIGNQIQMVCLLEGA